MIYKMVKTIINYIVDILMLVEFVITSLTAFTRSRLHNSAGAIFIILVIIHILLHWKWFVSVTRGFFRKV